MSDGLEHTREICEARLVAQDAGQPGYAAAFRAFSQMLLEQGGRYVVPPGSPDPLLELFLNEGTPLPRKTPVVMRPGQQSACHTNSIELWDLEEAVAIGTGYALSDDGLWREHSWAWDGNTLIETTVDRIQYFGVRLEGPDAEMFADAFGD